MTTGKVKWFNARKGYGFITTDAAGGKPSEDLFVHFKQVASALKSSGLSDKDFSEGRPVSFDRIDDGKNRPRAENLKIL